MSWWFHPRASYICEYISLLIYIYAVCHALVGFSAITIQIEGDNALQKRAE